MLLCVRLHFLDYIAQQAEDPNDRRAQRLLLCVCMHIRERRRESVCGCECVCVCRASFVWYFKT